MGFCLPWWELLLLCVGVVVGVGAVAEVGREGAGFAEGVVATESGDCVAALSVRVVSEATCVVSATGLPPVKWSRRNIHQTPAAKRKERSVTLAIINLKLVFLGSLAFGVTPPIMPAI